MFTTYIKYISLLLFSGLILTFYRITLPAAAIGDQCFKLLPVADTTQPYAPFSILKDIILPLFPALNKA